MIVDVAGTKLVARNRPPSEIQTRAIISPGERVKQVNGNITFSQMAVESVLRDIREGNTDFVDQFFANRPDWQEKQDDTSKQTDNRQAAKSEKQVAQA